MKSPWVLLTGATGFLGSHLSRRLADNGYLVAALLRPGRRPPQDPALSECLQAGELPAFLRSFEPQAAIHLATAYGNSESVDEVHECNVDMPLILMEACLDAGTPRFINTDTFFGKMGVSYPHMRTYTETKRHFLHEAIMRSTRSGSLAFSTLRLEHVFGERDRHEKFVPTLIRKLKNNVPTIPMTRGDQQRDFIDVSDVADAYLAVLRHAPAEATSPQEFEVGTGSALPVRAFAELAKTISASSSDLQFGAIEHRECEIMYSCANTEKLRQLGWSSRITLSAALQRLIRET